ncbi:RED-like protein N-terminal region-domain-containing protein [Cunninghamella echinulata]|nr:RED-like protein N-terminal region-domain-containing protein [Cunninghamella echinulata]
MAEEEGLSQEDFRKLLQTPRPGTTTTPKFKAPPPKTPRNSGAVFAKPASVRNKKKKNGEDDSKNKTTTQSNYRDRAAERRIEEQGSETTEDLLRPMEEDESLNAQQIYEQSKYLGGDLQHTHLVKGLDYTLLNKVRRQLQEKKKVNMDDDDDNDQPMATTDEQVEDELEDVLDRLDKGETFAETKDDVVGDISKLSITAKTLHDLLIPSSSSSDNAVKVHELFKPGRMAFVFPLATVKGGYQVGKYKQPKLEYTGDPFAMPTAVIRSKADLSDKQLQQQQKQSKHSSGWSDDALQESNLIISKIAQVMQRSQSTSTTNINETNTTTTTVSNKKSAASATKLAPSNDAKDDDDNSDDEIFLFGDVGTDYTLDESIIEKNKKKDQQETSSISKTNYFMDEEADGGNQNETMEHEVETPSKFSDIKSTSTTTQYGNMIENDRMDKKRKYNHLMDPTLEEGIDADSQDMDMFGLSTSALPTSFEDRQRMYVLDDDEEDDDENGKRPDGRKKSGVDDDDDDKPTTTLLIDQGTHKNKKAQLSRWDFDDEEQWQHYKSTIEIQPKSAAQFGVKMGDGRKRNKERRLMSDKQKLNREYQQVKNIMDKKYGKN